jgi:zinc/manganese transport system ATP-binding protein
MTAQVPRTLEGEAEALVRFEHVACAMGSRLVLRDVSLAVRPGEFVGVIGTNGAGKTTLLRLILGLLRPSEGRVEVFGAPARRGNAAVGYVPQKQQFDPDLPLRARDLVALGLDGHRWGFALPSAARRRRVDEALEAVGAGAYAEAPVGRLSGGEQQRLMIAQALLGRPRLLLLDEPLANLDLRGATEIVTLVAHLAAEHQATVLLVAHDINPLLPVIHRVLYLAEGRAALGPVEEVVRGEVLSSLYGYPVDVLRLGERILVVAGQNVVGGGFPQECDAQS